MKGLMGWEMKMVAGLGWGECLTRGILGSVIMGFGCWGMATWRSSVLVSWFWSSFFHSQRLLGGSAR